MVIVSLMSKPLLLTLSSIVEELELGENVMLALVACAIELAVMNKVRHTTETMNKRLRVILKREEVGTSVNMEYFPFGITPRTAHGRVAHVPPARPQSLSVDHSVHSVQCVLWHTLP